MKEENIDNTTNSTVYKKLRHEITLGCTACPPNKGCNRRRKKKSKNWKQSRKTKFKLHK